MRNNNGGEGAGLRLMAGGIPGDAAGGCFAGAPPANTQAPPPASGLGKFAMSQGLYGGCIVYQGAPDENPIFGDKRILSDFIETIESRPMPLVQVSGNNGGASGPLVFPTGVNAPDANAEYGYGPILFSVTANMLNAVQAPFSQLAQTTIAPPAYFSPGVDLPAQLSMQFRLTGIAGTTLLWPSVVTNNVRYLAPGALRALGYTRGGSQNGVVWDLNMAITGTFPAGTTAQIRAIGARDPLWPAVKRFLLQGDPMQVGVGDLGWDAQKVGMTDVVFNAMNCGCGMEARG